MSTLLVRSSLLPPLPRVTPSTLLHILPFRAMSSSSPSADGTEPRGIAALRALQPARPFEGQPRRAASRMDQRGMQPAWPLCMECMAELQLLCD